MQFDDSPERSTDLLRQALPLMSRQTAALHPMSYALWYAYVSDAGSALRAEVDQLLTRQGKLDEAATEMLYRRHLAGMDAATAQRVGDDLQHLIGGMSDQAARANDQTERYGHTLARAVAALADTDADAGLTADANHPSDLARPARLVDELLSQTQQMQSHMAALHRQLLDSQREINQLRDQVTRAREESRLDTLTGLANRRAFDHKLADCLRAEAGAAHPPCLLLADLDHFKRINDTYGHGFGDQVLRAVAQLLKSMIPEAALAARIGGEEFAVLLPAWPLPEANALAERLRSTVAANRIRRKGQSDAGERVTLSFGVATRRQGEDAEAFVERADRALYAAKSAGRDRVVSEA